MSKTEQSISNLIKTQRAVIENQKAKIEAQAKEIERLKEVMKAVRDDLDMRADLKGDQYVDLSDSQWIALNEALS